MSISFQSSILIGIAIINFVIAVYVLVKNFRNITNWAFFILTAGAAAWIVGIALLLSTRLFVFDKVILYGGTIMVLGLYLLAKVFPDRPKLNFRFIFSCLPFIPILIIIPLDLVIQGLEESQDSLVPINGPAFPMYAAIIAGYVLVSLIMLSRKYFRARGSQKLQMQYLFAGATIFILSALVFDVLLPSLNIFTLNLVGPASSIVFVSFTAYAIVRHRLLDVEVVVRRGTVFTLLFGVIITLLITSTSLLNRVLPLGVSEFITAFLLTVMFIPTKNVLERVTDRIFFRRGYRIDEALTNLNHILIRTTNLDHLAKNILNHIGQTLKVSKAMAFIAESQEEFILRGVYGQGSQLKKLDNQSRLVRYLQSYPLLRETHEKEILTIYDPTPDADGPKTINQVAREQWQIVTQELVRLGFVLVMPIFAKRKLIGILLLGEKKNGDYFSNQDMSFLDLASHEIAFSVENGLNIERLLRVDEVKSEFITVVSHQLRTPLSVARWNFELLLTGAFGEIPKKIREIVEGTHLAMMDLNQGVNNLMTALEIEEGKVVTHFEEVNLGDVIDEAINGVQQEAGLKQVTIERDFNYSDLINIDRHKIQRILEILLDNAVRYSQPKSKVILKSDFTSDPERELRISIEDFGIGIDPKNYEVIFQKFFRGDQAKKASPGGFGLGMFISKAYVELHGGKIGIQPKEGPGTIIYFTIPIRHLKNHQLPTQILTATL